MQKQAEESNLSEAGTKGSKAALSTTSILHADTRGTLAQISFFSPTAYIHIGASQATVTEGCSPAWNENVTITTTAKAVISSTQRAEDLGEGFACLFAFSGFFNCKMLL